MPFNGFRFDKRFELDDEAPWGNFSGCLNLSFIKMAETQQVTGLKKPETSHFHETLVAPL
jgi:hypothetical protein